MPRRPVILAVLALAGVVAGAPVTLARFTAGDAASGSFGTGVLLPPTALAGTGGTFVTLAWTPTVSTAAEGYLVLRSDTAGAGHAQVATVAPRGATTTTDGPGEGTWYYVLRSYLGGWSSASSNEAMVVVATGSGFVACDGASQAAEAGGDGDGYEADATAACATDGAYATDAGTGTSTAGGCTGAGKDRHRFWGFALGLPGSVASIDGIELRAVVGMSNNGGTSRLCAELSWDGGASWTAPQAVELTDASLTPYTLGGPADTWGRAWTPAELDPANLQVRLTDVTTHPNKDFRLDGLSLRVHYTP